MEISTVRCWTSWGQLTITFTLEKEETRYKQPTESTAMDFYRWSKRINLEPDKNLYQQIECFQYYNDAAPLRNEFLRDAIIAIGRNIDITTKYLENPAIIEES